MDSVPPPVPPSVPAPSRPSTPPPVPGDPSYAAGPGPVPGSGGSGSGKKWALWGCGGCLGILVLLAIVGVVVITMVFGALKKTDVYAETVKRAQASPELQAAAGSPIEPGWLVSGSMQYNNGEGSCTLTIPVQGSKSAAVLTVKAEKAAGGPWVYEVMDATLPGGARVDLLGKSPAALPPVEAGAPSGPEPP